MSDTLERLASIALTVLLVMFSAIVHEVAHGLAALACGDPTAKEHGRLTLNPAAHLDGFGSVLLPLVMALLGGPVFAFAKPVPYNPHRLRDPRRDELVVLRNPRRDELIVALAGPASNLLQALLGAGVLHLAWEPLTSAVLAGSLSVEVFGWIYTALYTYVAVNLVLCFFNLIPIPPLDGSKVVLYFLSGEARASYYRLQQYAMPILIVVLYLVPSMLRVDPVGMYLDATAYRLLDLLLMGV